jgi:hypothetical protein
MDANGAISSPELIRRARNESFADSVPEPEFGNEDRLPRLPARVTDYRASGRNRRFVISYHGKGNSQQKQRRRARKLMPWP